MESIVHHLQHYNLRYTPTMSLLLNSLRLVMSAKQQGAAESSHSAKSHMKMKIRTKREARVHGSITTEAVNTHIGSGFNKSTMSKKHLCCFITTILGCHVQWCLSILQCTEY